MRFSDKTLLVDIATACLTSLGCMLVCSLSLFLSCLASEVYYYFDSIFITCYMRVYDTDTSAGTYSAYRFISPLGSHPFPRKRESVQTVRSCSYT